jgi:hypothetical protein
MRGKGKEGGEGNDGRGGPDGRKSFIRGESASWLQGGIDAPGSHKQTFKFHIDITVVMQIVVNDLA